MMFPDVSLWTGDLGAACGAIWWAACWIFPWFLWSVTGWCGLWWSRTCWCPSRSPPRISCWWGRSPEPLLLLCTLQGSVSASNHHPPLKNKHIHTFMHFISHLKCYVFNLSSAVWTLKDDNTGKCFFFSFFLTLSTVHHCVWLIAPILSVEY